MKLIEKIPEDKLLQSNQTQEELLELLLSKVDITSESKSESKPKPYVLLESKSESKWVVIGTKNGKFRGVFNFMLDSGNPSPIYLGNGFNSDGSNFATFDSKESAQLQANKNNLVDELYTSQIMTLNNFNVMVK